MEIAVVSPTCIRIKGKQVTFLVNPENGKSKTPADAVLLLDKLHTPEFFRDDVGVVFQGAGEYEVKAAKTTGFTAEGDVMYTISLDGMSVFVGNSSSCMKAKDKLHEHDVAIIFADDVLTQAGLGFLNPKVVVFFGEKLQENATAFGKDMQKVNKYAVTKDKLPAEAEFIFLV